MNTRTAMAMLLAFLIPGAGHFYLGRRARAAAFFSTVVFLFVVGLSIDGRLYTIQQGNILSLLATLGSMGAGVLYFAARFVQGMHIAPFGTLAFGDITSITFEYGTAFVLTAGLMNLLLVLDAFDIAEGRKE